MRMQAPGRQAAGAAVYDKTGMLHHDRDWDAGPPGRMAARLVGAPAYRA